MAPSKTPGAVRPVTRSAARNVLVCGRTARGRGEGPTIPPQEIVRHAGFIEKNQACRIPGRRGGVPHDPRGRDVRSIVGGPDRHVQSRHRAPDSPDWPACRARPSARLRCDPVAPRSARPGCAGGAPTSGAARAAGRAARLRPSPADAASTAGPAHALHRNVRGLHPGITVEQGPWRSIAHRSSCIGACRSTTTSPSSTRAI